MDAESGPGELCMRAADRVCAHTMIQPRSGPIGLHNAPYSDSWIPR